VILFFDTETTGLPRDWRADPRTDPDAWPHLVEIAWVVYGVDEVAGDQPLVRVDQASYLVRPVGFTIPPAATALHGISQEEAELRGCALSAVMRRFLSALSCVDTVVTHNAAFDRSVVAAALARLEWPTGVLYEDGPASSRTWCCTMETTTGLLKLPGLHGRYKWPRLEELARYLGLTGGEQHRAATDVETLVACWLELRRRGFWGPDSR